MLLHYGCNKQVLKDKEKLNNVPDLKSSLILLPLKM